MSAEALTGRQVAAAGLSDWVFLLHYGLHGLETRIHTEDFAASLRIARAVGEASPPWWPPAAQRSQVLQPAASLRGWLLRWPSSSPWLPYSSIGIDP
jgi:hypothetical protein